jgi:two-component system, NtrC family, C4-dicarboxylate transport sensor histidine kinase DctB
MFKEQNLPKLILAVPIIFIILTASFVTLIHINQADNKFKADSSKLRETFLEEEKQRLNTVLESINSYIVFKKASSLNILKDKVKSRVEFADDMLTKLYNNKIGIESNIAIQINLLSSLGKMESDNKGSYFIYAYNDSNILKDNKSGRDFTNKINDLIKVRNEGLIFYQDEILKDNRKIQVSKVSYIKKFELENIILGYTESISEFSEKTKDEVLNRFDLMKIQDDGDIFTLNYDLDIIEHSRKKELIRKNLLTLIDDKELFSSLKDFFHLSKLELNKVKYYYYWKKVDFDNYQLYIFNYVPDWDWLVSVCVKVDDINSNITNIIGIKEAQRNDSINDSIKASLIFILIASIISYFISNFINRIFKNYKRNIERQKNALKNLNSTLESKVEEKTKQLENLNSKLTDRFKDELHKNRQKDQLLYDQSKMAVMGEMIGNIAHQWRQPLSTISTIASGNSVKLQFDIFDKDDLKNDFNKIVDTTQHLSDTIDDFRNFLMENKNIEKFDLIDIVEKDLNLISPSIQKYYINIIRNFNSVEIRGIKNELVQAILNILTNAKDALLSKKENNRVIVIDIFKDDIYANIVIKDSGGGIPDNIKEKIFEPYFTTKDKSTGTGIGLYMTKQIIEKNMKGNLSIKNEEFVFDENIYYGACFKILLPLI